MSNCNFEINENYNQLLDIFKELHEKEKHLLYLNNRIKR